MHKAILFILLFPLYLNAQHGAFIAPVTKLTRVNQQSAFMYGIKAGWVINNSFIVGGAFYGLATKINQSWVDPVNNSSPYIFFNTGGLNLEYIAIRHEPFSLSIEMFLGGAGIKLLPFDESKTYTDLYGGDFLFFEPQLNINYNVNEWLHLSLGLSYRYASGFDIYPGGPRETNDALPTINIKSLQGPAASISLIFGMY